MRCSSEPGDAALFPQENPHLSDAELQVRIEELLKFLGISIYCSGAIPVSREIDELWHYWILQTQEYETLCSSLPGGKFIHHTSNDYAEYFDKDIGQHDNLLLDIRMLATYFANYGAFEANRAKYWLLASHLIERRGWTVEQLNEWLGSGDRPNQTAADASGASAEPLTNLELAQSMSVSDEDDRARR